MKMYRATTQKNLMMTTNNFRKSFRYTCTCTRVYRPVSGLPLFIANSLAPSQSYLKSSLSPVAFRVNKPIQMHVSIAVITVSWKYVCGVHNANTNNRVTMVTIIIMCIHLKH